jgi:hypothetical protein
MAKEFKDWIVSHIEGDEKNELIVKELRGMDKERLEEAIHYLFKLGYIEKKKWNNPYW